MAAAELHGKTARGVAATLVLSSLLAGCATSGDRWRALSSEGPLTRWAACMESDGYRAFEKASDAAGRALDDGATPISWTTMFLVALAECKALAADAGVALSPLNRSRLYRDTERMLQRKLAKSSGLK